MFTYCKFDGIDLGICRVGGPGLGNLLFPWARAIVAARRNGWIPVWPTWRQFKLGPFLRGEQDKRTYSNLFRPTEGYVWGLEKAKLMRALKTRGVSENVTEPQELDDDSIVVYAGMDGRFAPIWNDFSCVRNELFRIVRSEHLAFLSTDFRNTISVHVRLGDFQAYDDTQFSLGVTNMRVPIEWYVDVVNQLRAGKHNKVYIFSDADTAELRALLSLSNVQRITYGSAIADMLALSRSNILVGSNSTFSMWSGYLGQMPFVQPYGRDRDKSEKSVSNHAVAVDVGETLPDQFFSEIEQLGSLR